MTLLFNIPFCIIKKIKRNMLHAFLAINGGLCSIFVPREGERERGGGREGEREGERERLVWCGRGKKEVFIGGRVEP
jgi:hypothetical protein